MHTKLIHMIVVIVAGFSYSWVVTLRALVFLLTVGWRPTLVPRHVGLSIGQLITWQLAFLRASKQERVPQMQAMAFCNLILEVTQIVPHASVYLLEVTKSSPFSRRGIARGHGNWKVDL